MYLDTNCLEGSFEERGRSILLVWVGCVGESVANDLLVRDEARDGMASLTGPVALALNEVIDRCENTEGLAGRSNDYFELDRPKVAG